MTVDNLSACLQTIGNYDLVEKIAEGGMGTVYRGRNRSTNEIVAVKVVPPHLLSNSVVLKRFELEYNVAKNIDHPNIVKALDFGRDGDARFLVMEFVEGESLGQKIEREGRMDEQDAVRVVIQIAEALLTAHKQGMIHRDVKPDNILITADGVAKLTDLGLVKELETDLNLTRTGRGLGTPHFMAPEQFRNAKKADARCDIYSLGATMYMMVTGELPFQSNGPLDAWMKKINNEIESPRKHAPSLSDRIDWAIRRAMSPDPIHRPENCREFIEDLTGQSTRDMSNAETSMETQSEYWYLVYTDTDGIVHTVKGTIKGIRRSVRDGLLGDTLTVRASKSKTGPFRPLKSFPEFRDLVVQPATVPQPAKPVSDPKTTLPPENDSDSAKLSQSESAILATTTIGLSAANIAAGAKPKPTHGPTINLKVPEVVWSPELGKWLLFVIFFGSIGVLATFFMPTILRYVRFM